MDTKPRLPVNASSEQFSGINILQKIFIFLLRHPNRLSNKMVGSISNFISLMHIQSSMRRYVYMAI